MGIIKSIPTGADDNNIGKIWIQSRGTTSYYQTSPGPKQDIADYFIENGCDVIFETSQDAKDVLDEMKQILAKYGTVTLADFCDLVDIGEVPYTTNKYGWIELDRVKVSKLDKSFFIRLPKPMVFV